MKHTSVPENAQVHCVGVIRILKLSPVSIIQKSALDGLYLILVNYLKSRLKISLLDVVLMNNSGDYKSKKEKEECVEGKWGIVQNNLEKKKDTADNKQQLL